MQTTTNTQPGQAPARAASVQWKLDPAHTSVTFRVKHMMVSNVRGEFQKVTGEVTYDPSGAAEGRIDVEIDIASINTREPKRDAHLRSADFFDAEKYPKMTFRSRGIGKPRGGTIEVVGELTIRDTTRLVTLEVEGPTAAHTDPWGNVRIGASAKTMIKRSDFGMTWNSLLEAGGVLVGDEIWIEIDAELIQSQGGAA